MNLKLWIHSYPDILTESMICQNSQGSKLDKLKEIVLLCANTVVYSLLLKHDLPDNRANNPYDIF